MKHSVKTGLSFGFMSGIITTLGLIIGLHSSTHSHYIVIGGILVIAISDALSDAMGIHFSEESENRHSEREIWESTIATFFSKFFFSLTFVVPFLLFQLSTAIAACIVWGLSLIVLFSLYMAKRQGIKPHKPITEHLLIAVIVIIITHYVGDWVATLGTGL
jgi:VIT1/CCC1 family predicted Fe2+/Mn2+ transporter